MTAGSAAEGPVKLSHVLVLAASILIGCGLIAVFGAARDRYHYSALAVEGHLGRVDRYTGAVEIYDKGRGWVPYR